MSFRGPADAIKMVSGWCPGAKNRGAKHPVPVAGPAEMRAMPMRRGDDGFRAKPDGSTTTIVKPDGSTIAVAHAATVVPVAPVVDLPPFWFSADGRSRRALHHPAKNTSPPATAHRFSPRPSAGTVKRLCAQSGNPSSSKSQDAAPARAGAARCPARGRAAAKSCPRGEDHERRARLRR